MRTLRKRDLLLGSAAAVAYFIFTLTLPTWLPRWVLLPGILVDEFIESRYPDSGTHGLGHFHPGRWLIEDAVVALLLGVMVAAFMYLLEARRSPPDDSRAAP